MMMMRTTAMIYTSGILFLLKEKKQTEVSRCQSWIDDDENDGDDVHEWRFVFARG